jgi:ParB-like chromosome segregation protein Spo0J
LTADAPTHRRLDAVPCWVREMTDNAAFIALVLANSQSELLPLERGLHALKATDKGKHGKSVKAYADATTRTPQVVAREVAAARVAAEVSPRGEISGAALIPFARHLAELYAATPWLRPALVARLVQEGWTVDTARRRGASRTRPSRRRGWTARRSPRSRCRPDEVPRRGPWTEPHPRLSR